MSEEMNQETEHVITNPILVHTRNVAKDLLKISSDHDIAVDNLDFHLLDTKTYTRTAEEKKANSEWTELMGEDIAYYNEESAILIRDIFLYQEYDVEVFDKVESTIFDDFNCSIGANSDVTSVYLSIQKGSKLSYCKNLSDELYLLIQKKKLRANIMLELFENELDKNIEQLVARVRVAEDMVFSENERVLVSHGIAPIKTIDDYLNKNVGKEVIAEDSIQKMDYSKRDFVIGANKGDVLFEYIKPKDGTAGRNCRGEHISVEPAIKSNAPKFELSDKIEAKESDDKIEYIAVEGGYVLLENNTYDIQHSLEIDEISFKTTGSILTPLDADITITVKKDDEFEDAICNGMEVTVKNLVVDGGVGPSTVINSTVATIAGQTHQDSLINAEELNIHVHKGTANAKHAVIARLEHGVIKADSVHIEKAMGGTVIAKTISVDIVASHVKLIASETIEIQKLQGSENHFIIDPVLKDEEKEELHQDENKIVQATRKKSSIETELDKFRTAMKKNKNAYRNLVAKIKDLRAHETPVPHELVVKYKTFKNIIERIKVLEVELVEQNSKIEDLSSKNDVYKDEIFETRVINHDRWSGHNTIIYKLVNPEMEVSLIPEDGLKNLAFGLEVNEAGAYVIVPIVLDTTLNKDVEEEEED
ncbi:MAG: DUF342 domain-containing protein [Helicobacteraceae bacterium]|nr:DUF342 domain-containing protein [Helicobacteraceae bacterium]